MSGEHLNVIALISGGKDSFYSVLHCIHHGHRVVALANLFPTSDGNKNDSTAVRVIDPDQPVNLNSPSPLAEHDGTSPPQEKDLNSFMYQTVGHEVIPLYAQATGLPLYRQPILGSAVRHERDYDYTSGHEQGSVPAGDETESMLPLLRAVKARHPEANALCSGAILSTYQRTRVESIALRLGLTPLSYLWKYPILPSSLPGSPPDEAQLLRDMAAAGVEARIIKVASAGLDESHLWERVTNETGVSRIKASLRKFGPAEGASLGEGGEFETIVVDGPTGLFKKRIVVPENGRKVIPEGGGSTWLMLRGARLEEKPTQEQDMHISVREPMLLDARFKSVADALLQTSSVKQTTSVDSSKLINKPLVLSKADSDSLHWAVVADSSAAGSSIQNEIINVVEQIKALLSTYELEASQITSVIVVLRDMADFPKINDEYGQLFNQPNPPSRITISSGNLLPRDRNIVIYVAVPVASAEVSRNGLHVQSRSYWAPANIGPYSQATETSVTTDGDPTSLRSVFIAGQIPLIPASMVLPFASAMLLQEQIVLSLQHLWRIGSEMKVQCWTSAVTYLARQTSENAAQESAKLAGRAWTLAHGSPDDEDEDDNGPDAWDLKYNPQYQSLGGTDANPSCPSVPNWSVYTLRQQNEPESCIPPHFTAEIESLPRQSLVEWHAQTGLKNIAESCVELIHYPAIGIDGWQCWHMVVKAGHVTVVYTTISYVRGSLLGPIKFEELEKELGTAYQASLRRLQPALALVESVPYLGYMDVNKVGGLWRTKAGSGVEIPFALVPCHSLWNPDGDGLAAVALYKTILTAS